MSYIRAMAVEKARRDGICSSCLKNKVANNRMQCQRCIDTNNRKREKRKAKYAEYQATNYDYRKMSARTNPLREKRMAYAVKQKICTKCFGRPASEGLRQCDICLERKLKWKEQHPLLPIKRRGRKLGSKNKTHKPKLTKDEVRAKQKEYKKKKLYNKVRKLDLIKHAMKGVK